MKTFIKKTYIYMELGQAFILVRCFIVIHFVSAIMYRWRNVFRVIFFRVALLNCFTKRSRFGVGFNSNQLFWSLLSSFHYIMSLSVLLQHAAKHLLLDKDYYYFFFLFFYFQFILHWTINCKLKLHGLAIFLKRMQQSQLH